LERETIIENSLYAILWEGEEDNSFDQMAILYNDAEFLNEYFNEHIKKLTYYVNPSYTPQDAAIRTRREATALTQELKALATEGLIKDGRSLDDIFKPLHAVGAYNHPRYHTDVKAKGDWDEAPWLRVYAIKCDDNLYVITGFGLKLVKLTREEKIALLNKKAKPVNPNAKWMEITKWNEKHADALDDYMIIAMRILATLKEKKMTQKDLATQLGVSPQALTRIVKGRQNLTLNKVRQIEKVLGISLITIKKIEENQTQIRVKTKPAKVQGSAINAMPELALHFQNTRQAAQLSALPFQDYQFHYNHPTRPFWEKDINKQKFSDEKKDKEFINVLSTAA